MNSLTKVRPKAANQRPFGPILKLRMVAQRGASPYPAHCRSLYYAAELRRPMLTRKSSFTGAAARVRGHAYGQTS